MRRTKAIAQLQSGDSTNSLAEDLNLSLRKGCRLFEQGRIQESEIIFAQSRRNVETNLDSETRKVGLFSLILDGHCHWLLERPTEALAVWKQAIKFVSTHDEGTIRELAALGVVLTCFAHAELSGNDADIFATYKELAQEAVELAPHTSIALQLLARISTYSGDWENAIDLSRRALETRSKSHATTTIPGTLIRIAASGRVKEIRELMAQSPLREDLEPLWHTLRFELRDSVEPLPLEIKDSVMNIQEQMNIKTAAFGP